MHGSVVCLSECRHDDQPGTWVWNTVYFPYRPQYVLVLDEHAHNVRGARRHAYLGLLKPGLLSVRGRDKEQVGRHDH